MTHAWEICAAIAIMAMMFFLQCNSRYWFRRFLEEKNRADRLLNEQHERDYRELVTRQAMRRNDTSHV